MKAIVDALGHLTVILIVGYAGLGAVSILGNALDRPALERTMMRTTRGSGAPVRSAEAISERASASRLSSSMKASLGINVVCP